MLLRMDQLPLQPKSDLSPVLHTQNRLASSLRTILCRPATIRLRTLLALPAT